MLKAGFDVTSTRGPGSSCSAVPSSLRVTSSTLKAVDEGVFERVMEKFTFTGTRRDQDGLRADGNSA